MENPLNFYICQTPAQQSCVIHITRTRILQFLYVCSILHVNNWIHELLTKYLDAMLRFSQFCDKKIGFKNLQNKHLGMD